MEIIIPDGFYLLVSIAFLVFSWSVYVIFSLLKIWLKIYHEFFYIRG